MVFDEQPVADLLAVAVNRQRLAGQGILDAEWYQFFREMVWAVIVRAIGGQNRQTVGVVVSADQMVAGGLAGRIRAVRLVLVGFGERRIGFFQRAVNFVGRNVQQAKGLLLGRLQIVPVFADRFQQTKTADDIGLDKIFRTVNRAVDVGLGGKIDHSPHLVPLQQTQDQIVIADIAVHEHVASIVLQRSQIFRIAGVSQLVQIDDGFVAFRQPVQNEIAADKPGTAGD